MSLFRSVPNIKPYPHQDAHVDISQQQHKQYSIYRPAYHRIPSTPAVAPRNSKEVYASTSPEVSPIVVPSMSTATIPSQHLDFYHSAYPNPVQVYYSPIHAAYRHPSIPSLNYHQIISYSNPVMHHVPIHPIHHTLENATITYDTVDQDLQKELVKDVFFSPAMTTNGREMSPADSCSSFLESTCTQSEDESDGFNVSTPPPETPSELLSDGSDVSLFDFGLDLATTSTTSSTSNTSSYEEVMMADQQKQLAFDSPELQSTGYQFSQTNGRLPSPPALFGEDDYVYHHSIQNKRRRSDSVLQERISKKQRKSSNPARFRERPTVMASLSPPLSPPFSSALKNETLFDNLDCFGYASGEDSSDDETDYFNERSSKQEGFMGLGRFDGNGSNLDAASGFQSVSVFDHSSDDDLFSTTSWEGGEDEEEEETDLDSESDGEDEESKFQATPLPQKKMKKPSRASTTSTLPENEEAPVEVKKVEVVKEENDHLPKATPRPTAQPTIYQKLTKANVDWCRYCGTTEGVNWRPGPWGKRTLCNKHGCDYKGYGFACKLPRLDLTGFTKESIDERDRPVLQLYCSGCQCKDSWEGNVLVRCEGCPKAFHQKCCSNPEELNDEFVSSKKAWFCDAACSENAKRKRIVVELPRKRLPLMCAPKNNTAATSNSDTSRTRSLRETSPR